MRLTLRTLLAYMDGILDPEQQAELDKQVQASPEAKELIHRARDTMRRLRLPAPGGESLGINDEAANGATSGGGSERFDANAVAEYLDNAAAPQEVVNLELECLKSDTHLAEVAACHHILTMVLAERADVDPEARRRLYAIPEVAAVRAEQRAKQQAQPAATTAASPTAAEPERVPDYLKAGSSSLSRWAPAVAALLVLSVVSYAAFRPGGWLNPEFVAKADALQRPDAPEKGNEPNSGSQPSGPEAPAEPAVAPEGAQEDPSEAPPTSISPEEPPTGSGEAAPQPPAEPAAPAQPANDIPPAPNPALPMTPAAGPEATGDPAMEDSGGAADAPTDPAADRQTAADALAGKPEEDQAPLEPTAVATFSDLDQVLLRFNAEDNTWRRMPLRYVVMSGDRLLSLPTYHPVITLESGLQVELFDGTEIAIAPDASAAISRMRLVFGRLIINNATNRIENLTLTVGETEAQLILAERSVVAVEAFRAFAPGIDPLTEPAAQRVIFYAPQGSVEWSTENGGFAVEEPSFWQILDGRASAPEKLKSIDMAPKQDPTDRPDASWINGRKLDGWEQESTGPLQRQIDNTNPIWPQLVTAYNSPDKELKALAALSSGYVGHYEPFIQALGEPALSYKWAEVIATLRSAMAREPAAARGVKETLIEQAGPQRGEELYEMLVGYTAEQIGRTPAEWQAGPIGDLVERLGRGNLADRALANENLKQVTGYDKFKPTAVETRLNRELDRVQTRLKNGDLKPRWIE